MNRLIFVPQLPVPMRYQHWWLTYFENEFKKRYDEVIVLGEQFCNTFLCKARKYKVGDYNPEMFSPIKNAIKLETEQLKEYMELELTDNDTLFLSDISFPGIFTSILYHKPCSKMYAYCHATAKQKYDYYAPVRKSKFQVETGESKLFDKVFVASKYHQDMLGWKNTEVVALPRCPVTFMTEQFPDRKHTLVSVCRPTKQKVTKVYEELAEKTFGKIKRQQCNTWEEYNQLLTESKILLITSKADTFNYTILDAIDCGCIPLAPNNICFPEILPSEFLYEDGFEMIQKIRMIIKNPYEYQDRLRTKVDYLVDNFYENICNIMKGI